MVTQDDVLNYARENGVSYMEAKKTLLAEKKTKKNDSKRDKSRSDD